MQVDIYPTIAELAGTVPTDHLDGVSVVPAFDDPTKFELDGDRVTVLGPSEDLDALRERWRSSSEPARRG